MSETTPSVESPADTERDLTEPERREMALTGLACELQKKQGSKRAAAVKL